MISVEDAAVGIVRELPAVGTMLIFFIVGGRWIAKIVSPLQTVIMKNTEMLGSVAELLRLREEEVRMLRGDARGPLDTHEEKQ